MSYRKTQRARQQQQEADERRMKRMFWTGLTVPAVACTLTALTVGPDSWLGWAAVIGVIPAAAAGVAVAFMVQDRIRER